MKDVVTLTYSGNTACFSINSDILDKMGLKYEDLVEVEIFLEYKGETTFTINRKLRKMGSSLGVSLKKPIVKDLGLRKGDTFQVDIRVPTIKK